MLDKWSRTHIPSQKKNIQKHSTQPHLLGTPKFSLKIIKAFCCQTMSQYFTKTYIPFLCSKKNKRNNRLVFVQKIINKQLCYLPNWLLTALVHIRHAETFNVKFFENALFLMYSQQPVLYFSKTFHKFILVLQLLINFRYSNTFFTI